MILRLIERNLKLYLRDIMSVFFSFLSVILVLIMYAVFLGDNTLANVRSQVGDIVGIEELVLSWLLAGIVMISTVTVPLSVLTLFVEDKEKGTLNDFFTAPIPRSTLILSYLIASIVITSLMSFANFIVGQGYLLFLGYSFLSWTSMFQMLGLIFVSSTVFSTIFFYLTFLFQSERSFGSLGTIVGTLVGFFGGIYVPIGVMGSTVQTVVNLIPVSHSVSLFRQIYMNRILTDVFENAPAEILTSFREFYGLEVLYSGWVLPYYGYFIVFGLYIAVFYFLSLWTFKKQKL
jgi:multidrug/hemolysin transport system permease protein